MCIFIYSLIFYFSSKNFGFLCFNVVSVVFIFDDYQHPLWLGPIRLPFPVEILGFDSVRGCRFKIYFYMYSFPSDVAPLTLSCNIINIAQTL